MSGSIRKTVVSLGLLAVISAVCGSSAFSVALSDQVIQQLKQSGQLEAFVDRMRDLQAQGMDQPLSKPAGSGLAASRNPEGVYRVLVILIDFIDKRYWEGRAAATREDFDSVLFSTGKNPTGSMKEFYYENSNGKYIIEGTVTGWYTTPIPYAEYGSYGSLPVSSLARDAIYLADSAVDFRQFDNNNNGVVEAVIVVHAGSGHEESGNDDEIHSHMAGLGGVITDEGVSVASYTIQPEESAVNNQMSSIGVFCHEWGHVLNLPDLYDYDYSSAGVGHWSLMASGNYNNGSKSPAHLDAWCKYQLGWIAPKQLRSNRLGVEIPAIEHDSVVYLLNKQGQFGSEYWLVENRYDTGFDVGLPGYGLLIYHIDMSRVNNDNEWHPLMHVEQADGRYDLQYGSNAGDAGDPWPGSSQARQFHDKTVPNSRYYVEVPSQVGVWNISDPGLVMTADLEVTFTRPWIEQSGVILRDNAYGNGNNIPEAGEKIQLLLSLTNDWALASGITVTMTTDDPALNIVEGTSAFPDIGLGATQSNINDPFEFEIPNLYASRIDSFYFNVSANDGAYQTTLAAEANIGRPQVLIVDDDGGDADQLQNYLAWPLYEKRTPSVIWNKKLSGSPDIMMLDDYYIVIWLTGDLRPDILSEDDISGMKSYLNGGGNLFLTGQGLAEQLEMQDSDFLNNYLKAQYVTSTQLTAIVMVDSSGPVFGGGKMIVVNGAGGANNQTTSDFLQPMGGGSGEWYYLTGPTQPKGYGAISYNGDYKSVYLAFGFEAVRSNDTRFESRTSLMAKILDFFGDIPTDVADQNSMAINLPAKLVLKQNQPNPFNPATTISYVITGSGSSRPERTRLEVVNVLGQRVATLVDRDLGPGQYSVTWDGRDSNGRIVASGLYFYWLTRASQSETRKMVLIK